MYATAYAVTQRYGGPEEGGWWYDHYRLLKSMPTTEATWPADRDALTQEFRHENYGRLHSVLGGQEVWVRKEEVSGQYTQDNYPRYE